MTDNRNQDQKTPSSNTEHTLLTAMFSDRESTENAYNTLHDRGYTKEEINLIMTDETRKKHFSGDALVVA
jgi:hypothetical protein